MSKDGTVNVKDEEGRIRSLEMKDKLACCFAGGRIVLIGESEDGNFRIQLTNPEESARDSFQGMHLTEGSLIAVYAAMSAYFHDKGMNVMKLLKDKYFPENIGYVPCSFERYDDNEKKV